MPDFDLDAALGQFGKQLPVCRLCHQPMMGVSLWSNSNGGWASFVCRECKATSSVTLPVQVTGLLMQDGGQVISGEALKQAKLGACPICHSVSNLECFGNYARHDHVGSRWDCAECGTQWEIIWEVANA